ncbi:hypothetical protein IFM89_025714 [Coptis chinensis]|uniref:Uncharacterized protein n=1 Tax=Coptis chinensis TaxID=261450 RepID=A0A835HH09_9MAGN|nr:hypothetical protein IFM89_025714 [Coptis chinensis]
MASPSFMFFLVITLGTIVCDIDAAPTVVVAPKASEVPNVKLSVYYETLSPSSSWFIYFQLSLIFENGLIDIIDLHLVPSGNARNNAIVCEHGEDEGFLNTVEACAIYLLPLDKHYPFLSCVGEYVKHENYNDEWIVCFEKTGMDETLIADCVKSGVGHHVNT